MAATPFEVLTSVSETYRFKLSATDERVWELPLMGSLPVKVLRRLTKVGDGADPESVDAMCEALDGMCPGLSDVVTLDQMAAIFARWGELSGISMGESSGSAD